MKNEMKHWFTVLAIVMVGLWGCVNYVIAEVTGPKWGQEGGVWYMFYKKCTTTSNKTKNDSYNIYVPKATQTNNGSVVFYVKYKLTEGDNASFFLKIGGTSKASESFRPMTMLSSETKTVQFSTNEGAGSSQTTKLEVGWSGENGQNKYYDAQIKVPPHIYCSSNTLNFQTVVPISSSTLTIPLVSFLTSGNLVVKLTSCTLDGVDVKSQNIITSEAGSLISGITIASSNAVYSPYNQTLSATDLEALQIKFNPTTTGVLSANIEISDGTNTVNITVSGKSEYPSLDKFPNTDIGSSSIKQDYSLAKFLSTGAVTVTAPNGYLVSGDGGTSWNDKLTLNNDNRNQTISVKYVPNDAQDEEYVVLTDSKGKTLKIGVSNDGKQHKIFDFGTVDICTGKYLGPHQDNWFEIADLYAPSSVNVSIDKDNSTDAFYLLTNASGSTFGYTQSIQQGGKFRFGFFPKTEVNATATVTIDVEYANETKNYTFYGNGIGRKQTLDFSSSTTPIGKSIQTTAEQNISLLDFCASQQKQWDVIAPDNYLIRLPNSTTWTEKITITIGGSKNAQDVESPLFYVRYVPQDVSTNSSFTIKDKSTDPDAYFGEYSFSVKGQSSASSIEFNDYVAIGSMSTEQCFTLDNFIPSGDIGVEIYNPNDRQVNFVVSEKSDQNGGSFGTSCVIPFSQSSKEFYIKFNPQTIGIHDEIIRVTDENTGRVFEIQAIAASRLIDMRQDVVYIGNGSSTTESVDLSDIESTATNIRLISSNPYVYRLFVEGSEISRSTAVSTETDNALTISYSEIGNIKLRFVPEAVNANESGNITVEYEVDGTQKTIYIGVLAKSIESKMDFGDDNVFATFATKQTFNISNIPTSGSFSINASNSDVFRIDKISATSFDVYFFPQETSSYEATITITDGKTNRNYKINVFGKAGDNIISFAPSEKGAVSKETKTFEISGLTATSNFSVVSSSSSFSVSPGTAANNSPYTIGFTPQITGSCTGTINLKDNQTLVQYPLVTLTGDGTAPQANIQLNYSLSNLVKSGQNRTIDLSNYVELTSNGNQIPVSSWIFSGHGICSGFSLNGSTISIPANSVGSGQISIKAEGVTGYYIENNPIIVDINISEATTVTCSPVFSRDVEVVYSGINNRYQSGGIKAFTALNQTYQLTTNVSRADYVDAISITTFDGYENCKLQIMDASNNEIVVITYSQDGKTKRQTDLTIASDKFENKNIGTLNFKVVKDSKQSPSLGTYPVVLKSVTITRKPKIKLLTHTDGKVVFSTTKSPQLPYETAIQIIRVEFAACGNIQATITGGENCFSVVSPIFTSNDCNISYVDIPVYFTPTEGKKSYTATLTLTPTTGNTISLNLSGYCKKRNQIISWDENQVYKANFQDKIDEKTYTISAHSNVTEYSGEDLTITYGLTESSPKDVINVTEDGIISILKTGTAEIKATQVGSTCCTNAAPQITTTFTVEPANTMITFTPEPQTLNYPSGEYTATVTTTNTDLGSTISYSVKPKGAVNITDNEDGTITVVPTYSGAGLNGVIITASCQQTTNYKETQTSTAPFNIIWDDVDIELHSEVLDGVLTSTSIFLLNEQEGFVTSNYSKDIKLEYFLDPVTSGGADALLDEDTRLTLSSTGKLIIRVKATHDISGDEDTETCEYDVPYGILEFNKDGKWTDCNNWSRSDIVQKYTEDHTSDLSDFNVVITKDCFLGKDDEEVHSESQFLEHTVNAICNNLTIRDEGNAKLVIGEASTLKVNGTLTNYNADRLRLTANYWGQASLVYTSDPVDSDNKIRKPKATIEMFIPEGNGSKTDPIWQYRGIAVEGFAIKDGPWGCMAIYKWNEANNETSQGCWTAITNGGASNDDDLKQKLNNKLQPWVGYAFANICYAPSNAATWLSYTGTLINSNQAISLGCTGTKNYKNKGMNLITNSYTVPMIIEKLGYPSSGCTKGITLYNAGSYAEWKAGRDVGDQRGNQRGQYSTVPATTGKATGILTIPAGQSFFVKANTNGNNLNLTYDANHYSLSPSDRLYIPKQDSAPEFNILTIDVIAKSDSAADRLYLIECDSCSKQYENGYDGYKIIGNEGLPQIYAYNKFGNTAVNADSTFNKQYIGFNAGSDDETYTISFETDQLFGYHSLYLVDRKQNQSVDILAGETYSFKGYSVGENMRFQINGITEEEWQNDYDHDDDNDNDRVCDLRVIGNTLYVQGFTTFDYPAANIELYDMAGNRVWSTPLTVVRLYDLPVLPNGVYTIRLGDCHVKYVAK